MKFPTIVYITNNINQKRQKYILAKKLTRLIMHTLIYICNYKLKVGKDIYLWIPLKRWCIIIRMIFLFKHARNINRD
jgi:hypothetical protein